jgi:hypothetical protein
MPITNRPWRNISLDFVTGPPLYEGYHAVLVVEDTLTKERHFGPCFADDRGMSTEITAKISLRDVFNLHGLPESMVSDRRPQFIAEIWTHLCRILQIKKRLSTAFHP